MTDDILKDILVWSRGQPAWQRDALRRLFTTGTLAASDLDDLADLCKAAHGLSSPRISQPLGEDDLAISGGLQAEPVSLVSITHHRGVNALADEQTLSFGPKLTIVFGENAAGKSGYTRILKRACRSRSAEKILGNVLSGDPPLKAQATILFREGNTETPLSWTSEIAPSGPLAAISVFDSHSAPVYLRDKTDVAFRPFGLDIFDKLSAACSELRQRLDKERTTLDAARIFFPQLPEGTRAKAILDNLTSLTKPETIQTLAILTQDEERRLKELQDRRRDFQATDPKRLAQELELKAQRIEVVINHIAPVSTTFGDIALESLKSASDSLRIARETLAILRKSVSTAVLSGTGEEAWRGMWEAAAEFSEIAYPGSAFPVLTDHARCLLCQQEIGIEAAERFKHFHQYISSTAQADVRKAEETYRRKLNSVTQVTIARNDVNLALTEFETDDPNLVKKTREFLENTAEFQKQLQQAIEQQRDLPKLALADTFESDLRAAVKKLRDRASQLQVRTPTMDPKEMAELKELEARVILKDNLQAVLGEIERKSRLAAYVLCLEDVATQPITRKSTDHTRRLVTDHLREVFQEELKRLKFTDLAVEIQSAGGTRGVLFHHLVFTAVPGVPVIDVLSEGESRALSLAAFLTELSTSATQSGIIFDDPVSSFDHIWRGRIARRLVEEAKVRQVIVFTHDLLFLRFLMDEASRQAIDFQHQYIRRYGHEAGRCSADLPWIAMGVTKRIGVLRNRLQSAEKLLRDSGPDVYQQDASGIYGLLREAWEHAVSEVLLNDVVERYRHSIETKKAQVLHDITEDDCKAIDLGMSECSRWMSGHDQPPADGTPFPTPDELRAQITDLDNWVQTIRKRRQSKK
jgi:hypothetical protein